MITEQLINDADEKVRALCVEASSLRYENKRLRFWVYVLLGVSTVFTSMLIYSYYYNKFNLYK
jgi:hypothetical protein